MAKLKARRFYPFISIVFLLLLFLFFFLFPTSPFQSRRSFSTLPNPFPPTPRIAYFITGSAGDKDRMLRLLFAVYHPRNRYLLHLDTRALQQEREDLAADVGSVYVFNTVGNVDVVGNADTVNYGGSTPIASVLHGAAILLKPWGDWDWFVNLRAGDYPLITQDDFLHILSFLPRDFNFIEHTSKIGWKEYQRIKSVVVDPGIYLASLRGRMFFGSRMRPLPAAYKFFTGSPFVILSRELIDFSVLGYENLPRTLLLYFTNIKSSHQGYFQTLACNSREFRSAVINSNLRFEAWDNPPRLEPRNLKLSDYNKMVTRGAAFAGSFQPNDPVLDKIDKAILHRRWGKLAPGGWCVGRDPCEQLGELDILRPDRGAKRFEKLLLKLLATENFRSNICVFR
ncbi:beta-glucuronosyltransferase GlcAT14A-like [Aristolochia californica]|uniref:beta-glucuronosyltransferase GlcAT14A-like n=1 Tax=Aristolochia californica TaxID=171875 RepID=UPI0035DB2B15